MLNFCYNCVDRHLETNGDKTAIVYDSTICNVIKKYTFKELHDNVSRLGGVLEK
jgi:acetyl-CoA synthetase